MALFESYERRIKQIDAVLSSYGMKKLRKKQVWMFTIWLKEFNPFVLKMQSGLT